MNERLISRARQLAVALLAAMLVPAWAQNASPRMADYIVAVVDQELVTAVELEQRLARVRDAAARNGERLPPERTLRQQMLDALIEERAILSHARDSGVRVEDAEVDRAVQGVATQNKLSLAQLRDRLRSEGIDYGRFRSTVRDQLMIERVREREVQQRIRVRDSEIDAYLEKQRGSAAGEVEYNIAQILVSVPENASDEVVAQRRARAEQAAARVRGGEDFAAVARQLSEDANRERGGEIGLRPADRLPDVFLEKVRSMTVGQVAPELLRTGAGFHVLKLLDRRDGSAQRVTQTRARHILLRPSAQLAPEAANRQLLDLRARIDSGSARFDELARQFSQDGSAEQGGDLGWASPGTYVPEFESAMNALPVGGLSEPVVSRFGVHLIQVVERRQVAMDSKQLREQARNVLREQKFEEAYAEWARDLRSRAYVELREPPQ